MTWWDPATYLNFTVGHVVTETDMQRLKDNLLHLDQHVHDDSAGSGDASLGPLVKLTTSDQGSDPSAPGSGKVVLYTKSGVPYLRAGASGSADRLVKAGDGTTHGDVLFLNSSSIWARKAPGVAGQFFQTQGSGADPVWANITAIATIAEGDLAGLSTLTFSSIPATFRHLLLVVDYEPSNAAAVLRMRWNGISTNAYDWVNAKATGTTMTVSNGGGIVNTDHIQVMQAAPNTQRRLGATIVLPHYAASLAYHSCHFNGGGGSDAMAVSGAGYFDSTARVISSIEIYPSAGTFTTGRATLYGLPTA